MIVMLRPALLLLLALLGQVAGHARLIDPPSRSSAWRYGFSTPKNVNDNELNCGGAGNQWASQGGKCGLCGDPYQAGRPRANEIGGKYGIGVITKTYTQGEWINIGTDVTANHKGWYEIKICNLDTSQESEECFDQHLLEVEGGGTRWNLPGGVNKVFNYKVKLPEGLSCSHCSLQWKWHCGNNWGIDRTTGKGCSGCGPQEEFWGCSDISITGSGSGNIIIKELTKLPTQAPTTKRPATQAPTTSTTTTTTTTRTPRPTAAPITTRPPARITTMRWQPSRTWAPLTRTWAPLTRTWAPLTRRPSGTGCRATGLFARIATKTSYDYWCRTNCAQGNCPANVCHCD